MSHTTVVLITIVLTVTVLFGGCYGMNRYIYNCKGCEFFNIDNFELRTSTDIKNSRHMDCSYDEATRTKTSVFYMDIKGKELSNYIGFNGFAKVCGAPPQFGRKVWDDSIKKVVIANLYFKKGSYKKDSWVMVFDSSKATLWAEIKEAP